MPLPPRRYNDHRHEVIRERLAKGQTLTLEEYQALNPDGTSLTELRNPYHSNAHLGETRGDNTLKPASTIALSQSPVNGRVRRPGLST